jgi:hypothetical protein
MGSKGEEGVYMRFMRVKAYCISGDLLSKWRIIGELKSCRRELLRRLK